MVEGRWFSFHSLLYAAGLYLTDIQVVPKNGNYLINIFKVIVLQFQKKLRTVAII